MLKAMAQKLGMELRGHGLANMLRIIANYLKFMVPEEIEDIAKQLDRLYIVPRYPNGVPSGAPFKNFTKKDAENAISVAQILIRWCDSLGAGQRDSG